MYTKEQEHNILKGYNMLLYFAGSMIMHEPSEECITDFWTKGILKNLPVSSSNPNFVRAASQLRDSCEDKTYFGKRLCEDFVRLFAQQDVAFAPAFESLYQNNRESDLNRQSASVTEFYMAYGWESKFRRKINDDHLGIELLFLTVMIEKYLVLDDEACRVEMRKEIRRFIDNHILSWIVEWNRKVQIHSNTIGFKGISNLILASVEDISTLFDQHSITTYSIADLKN